MYCADVVAISLFTCIALSFKLEYICYFYVSISSLINSFWSYECDTGDSRLKIKYIPVIYYRFEGFISLSNKPLGLPVDVITFRLSVFFC